MQNLKNISTPKLENTDIILVQSNLVHNKHQE